MYDFVFLHVKTKGDFAEYPGFYFHTMPVYGDHGQAPKRSIRPSIMHYNPSLLIWYEKAHEKSMCRLNDRIHFFFFLVTEIDLTHSLFLPHAFKCLYPSGYKNHL